MNKLEPHKIDFDDNDFLVEIEKPSKKDTSFQTKIGKEDKNLIIQKALGDVQQEKETALNEAQDSAAQILDEANKKAKKIIDEANAFLAEAQTKAQELKEASKKEIDEQKEAFELEMAEIKKTHETENEELRIEKAKEGYQEGYDDGLIKIREELVDKIEALDNFCKSKFEIKEKILKSLTNEILDVINLISKRVLLKSVDTITLENIIKAAISKLEKKENIKIILSENYAKLLYELQKNTLNQDEDEENKENSEFSFEDFNQYNNFEVIYNSKFPSDTIMVENPEERFDASITSQLDIIVNNIFEKVQNNSFDFKEFEENKQEIEAVEGEATNEP